MRITRLKRDNNVLSNLMIFLVVLFKFLLFYDVSEEFLLKLLPLLSLICIIDIFLKNNYTKKQLIRTFIIIIPLVIFSVIIRSPNFLFPILVALLSLNRNFKDIAKAFGYSILFFLILTIILNNFGVIRSYDILRKIDGVYKVRYTLGFPHPNALMGTLVACILCFLYAYDFPKKTSILFIIIAVIFYYITYSRTPLIMLISVYLFKLINKFSPKIKYKIAPYSFLLCFIIVIGTTLIYSNSHFETLNKLFSDRLFINQSFINNGHLFQILPNMEVLENTVVDNYHFNIILRFGIIGFIFYMVYNLYTLKKVNYDTNLMIMCLAYALSSLTEDIAMISSLNFIMTIQMIIYINKERFILTNNEVKKC